MNSDDKRVEVRLTETKRLLNDICDYLVPLLPLANSHTVNFFSHDHWRTKIPANLKADLAKIADDSDAPTLMDLYFSLQTL